MANLLASFSAISYLPCGPPLSPPTSTIADFSSGQSTVEKILPPCFCLLREYWASGCDLTFSHVKCFDTFQTVRLAPAMWPEEKRCSELRNWRPVMGCEGKCAAQWAVIVKLFWLMRQILPSAVPIAINSSETAIFSISASSFRSRMHVHFSLNLKLKVVCKIFAKMAKRS